MLVCNNVQEIIDAVDSVCGTDCPREDGVSFFDYACACMSNSVDFASSVDSALAKTDNRYRMSKRRLDLLRFVRLNSGKDRRAGSLDREIEVLEAYPEENLPE